MKKLNELNKTIGRRIALLRTENKITQAELAEALDISTKHCSEVERGLSRLSIEKLVALCSILSTNLDYLVRGIDNPEHSDSNIPSYVVELFKTSDILQRELLLDYMSLFKKIKNLDER